MPGSRGSMFQGPYNGSGSPHRTLHLHLTHEPLVTRRGERLAPGHRVVRAHLRYRGPLEVQLQVVVVTTACVSLDDRQGSERIGSKADELFALIVRVLGEHL